MTSTEADREKARKYAGPKNRADAASCNEWAAAVDAYLAGLEAGRDEWLQPPGCCGHGVPFTEKGECASCNIVTDSLEKLVESAEKERDEALARAEKAEKERDEALYAEKMANASIEVMQRNAERNHSRINTLLERAEKAEEALGSSRLDLYRIAEADWSIEQIKLCAEGAIGRANMALKDKQ